uniref:Uncharacterized protein n=1 Tax=Glossina pallidipes TaxID=7398 RepID=A0A1A9ZTE0_GLOPL
MYIRKRMRIAITAVYCLNLTFDIFPLIRQDIRTFIRGTPTNTLCILLLQLQYVCVFAEKQSPLIIVENFYRLFGVSLSLCIFVRLFDDDDDDDDDDGCDDDDNDNEDDNVDVGGGSVMKIKHASFCRHSGLKTLYNLVFLIAEPFDSFTLSTSDSPDKCFNKDLNLYQQWTLRDDWLIINSLG